MSKKGKRGLLSSILQLGKIKIAIPVALTGFLGYYRAAGELTVVFIYTFFGILLLAMGSSTFNQVQERRTDKLMKRTADRPLPAERISLKGAILSGVLISLSGFIFLLLTGSWQAAATGLLTLGWYNLVYTPLKRITPFAVLPGAIIGALPPFIGWFAGGGYLLDKEILLISFFLFIGQMPHYWLLLMKIGDEFKNAGLPVITELFSRVQLRNISFSWIISAGIAVVIFPVSGIIFSTVVTYILLAGVIIFLIIIAVLSFKGEIMKNWRKAFLAENLFYLFVIVNLIADKFLESYLYM